MFFKARHASNQNCDLHEPFRLGSGSGERPVSTFCNKFDIKVRDMLVLLVHVGAVGFEGLRCLLYHCPLCATFCEVGRGEHCLMLASPHQDVVRHGTHCKIYNEQTKVTWYLNNPFSNLSLSSRIVCFVGLVICFVLS